MEKRSYNVVLTAVMAALANLLGFLAVPGPWNIKFGLTAIPILITAFSLGPRWGALCGLLGGVTQGLNYGSVWYVFYTAIQGGVAGYFARSLRATKLASVFGDFFGGFFLVLWVDLLRLGQHNFNELISTKAASIFGLNATLGIPKYSLLGGCILALIFFLISLGIEERSLRHLTRTG